MAAADPTRYLPVDAHRIAWFAAALVFMCDIPGFGFLAVPVAGYVLAVEIRDVFRSWRCRRWAAALHPANFPPLQS